MADDGAAVHAPLVGDRLVAGEALVGFAVAEGEQGGIGCPDRAGQNGHILIGDLFEANPVIFCFCGLWTWGLCRSCGMRSWNFPFQDATECGTLGFKWLSRQWTH